jgi:hypothetical protein
MTITVTDPLFPFSFFIISRLVLLIDVDFVPSVDTFDNLMKHPLLHYYLSEDAVFLPSRDIAFVVPAFSSETVIQIQNKAEAIKCLQNKTISLFGFAHHIPTNFRHWKDASDPYCVVPIRAHRYEPYVILSVDAPRYNNSFIGYGFNKVAHLHELWMRGYNFIVLENVLIVHLPHLKERKRKTPKVNKELWKNFVDTMDSKYPGMNKDCEAWKPILDTPTLTEEEIDLAILISRGKSNITIEEILFSPDLTVS